MARILSMAAALAAACWCTSAARATGEARTDSQYTPATTKVAVLPCITISPEKGKWIREQEADEGRKSAEAAFSDRGFTLLDEAAVDKAVSQSSIDLSSEEQWTKANLYRIGKAAGADLVVFVLIKNGRQIIKSNLLMPDVRSEAEIELWLADVGAEKGILAGEPAKGTARGGGKPSAQRRRAVKLAVESALRKFMKPYAMTRTREAKPAPAGGEKTGQPDPDAQEGKS